MSLSDDGEFASADEGEDVKKATASEKVANNANKEPVQKELDKREENSSWSQWNSWGSNILGAASSSVATFSNSVGDGFHSVIQSVEALGGARGEVTEESVVKAEETAPLSENIERNVKSGSCGENTTPDTALAEEETVSQGWLNSIKTKSWGIGESMSNVVQSTSSAIQSTSKNIVTGGIDVLESIGKKTYQTIIEGEHGFKSTIKKPNLSQLLRDAAKETDSGAEKRDETAAETVNFIVLFEEYQGLVHIEGLELLSGQCEGRVHSLLASTDEEQLASCRMEMQTIEDKLTVQELDEQEVDEHFVQYASDAVRQVGVNMTAEALCCTQQSGRRAAADIQIKQKTDSPPTPKEIYISGMKSLAELSAKTVEIFHKIGQRIVLNSNLEVEHGKSAACLSRLASISSAESEVLASLFTARLQAVEAVDEKDDISRMVTNIFLEASNGSSYVQDALKLLQFVLQQAALEARTRKDLLG